MHVLPNLRKRESLIAGKNPESRSEILWCVSDGGEIDSTCNKK
jgi:hypothetical protein